MNKNNEQTFEPIIEIDFRKKKCNQRLTGIVEHLHVKKYS